MLLVVFDSDAIPVRFYYFSPFFLFSNGIGENLRFVDVSTVGVAEFAFHDHLTAKSLHNHLTMKTYIFIIIIYLWSNDTGKF